MTRALRAAIAAKDAYAPVPENSSQRSAAGAGTPVTCVVVALRVMVTAANATARVSGTSAPDRARACTASVSAASRPVSPSSRPRGAAARSSAGPRKPAPTHIASMTKKPAWSAVSASRPAISTDSTTPPVTSRMPMSVRATPMRSRGAALSASATAGRTRDGRTAAISAPSSEVPTVTASAMGSIPPCSRNVTSAGTMPWLTKPLSHA